MTSETPNPQRPISLPGCEKIDPELLKTQLGSHAQGDLRGDFSLAWGRRVPPASVLPLETPSVWAHGPTASLGFTPGDTFCVGSRADSILTARLSPPRLLQYLRARGRLHRWGDREMPGLTDPCQAEGLFSWGHGDCVHRRGET